MMNEPTPTPIEETPLALPGSVKFYQRHLVVCTGQADWPARLETGGGFIQSLIEQVGQRAGRLPAVVKITACDAPSLAAGHDILLFPDAIRYVGLREADIGDLVEQHLVAGSIARTIPHRLLTGAYVFVCVHARRDERCGACGPPIVARFHAELAERGLGDKVFVHQSSHVGGHALAGNVLIYPGGDWYGRVTAGDVPRIIDRHLQRGQIVGDLWRGRMGLTPEAQVALVEASGDLC
jgi:(2Fe-2S) ferredoxin